MNRRSFLKIIGLTSAVLLMPNSVQAKVIRSKIAKTYKCNVIDSYNVKSVCSKGKGEYTVEFNNDISKSAIAWVVFEAK